MIGLTVIDESFRSVAYINSTAPMLRSRLERKDELSMLLHLHLHNCITEPLGHDW